MNNKVSCIMMTYNHEKYVYAALEGLFSQDYPNIKFIISDDASSDNTVKIINKFLDDKRINKENITFNVNSKNLGLINHINFIYKNFVTTSYVIGFPGDDISYSFRTSKIMHEFMKNSQSLILSNADIIDSKGKIQDKLYFKFKKKKIKTLKEIIETGYIGISGAGRAMHMKVFWKFGELPSSIENEDEQFPFRAVLLDGIQIIEEPLFQYRIHTESLSSWLWRKQSFSKYIDRYTKNIDNRIAHYKEWERLLHLDNKDEVSSSINKKINLLIKEKNTIQHSILFKIYIYNKYYILNKVKIIIKKMVK